MKRSIKDFKNPFDAITEFEKALAEFTGALGVIVTDSCTHAIELGLRYKTPKLYATIPSHTYISIPMTLMKLNVEFMYTEDKWENEYRIEGSRVYDSANYFEKDMFQPELGDRRLTCLSFGHGKPFEIGHGGAILTNDKPAHDWLKRAVYDGRDLSVSPWQDQKEFDMGYHYMMRPEDCVEGLNKLASGEFGAKTKSEYPNLKDITINKVVTER